VLSNINYEATRQHHHKVFPTCYTATRLPVKLVYSEQYFTRIEALSAEKKIQKWSRKKKEALISADWDKLSYYAKRKSK